MKVVINERLAKRNRQIATNLFLVTFLALIAGFVFVNLSLFTGQAVDDPLLLLVQTMILPVAFILTLISVRMTNLWARRPYPEDAIAEGLKGLSNKSVIYHYYHIPARHVLICPQGVFTITTRWHNGSFTVNADRWRTNASMISRFFSSMRLDGIGNPTWDAQRDAARIQKMLETIAPDVPVQPLILFVDQKATVQIENSALPILYAGEKQSPNLKEYLRDLNRDAKSKKATLPLTDDQIEQFEVQTFKGRKSKPALEPA
jgi:hypothetical protein